jgi:pimeloyl-[acyl-carrier protein] methyl ester esterase
MQIVFVHGWGFNAEIWQGIISHLPDRNVATIDLGFVASEAKSLSSLPKNSVIIGHSLGVLWSLMHMPARPVALISLCGFDRFSPPVPKRQLEIMKRGLKRNPEAQMTSFWRSCDITSYAAPEALNQEKLDEGLDWLMNWNAHAELVNLSCPVHVIAARDDKIVPEEMSCNIWQKQDIDWSPEGGHALPLTHPGWCADQIKSYLKFYE